jgi:hypothetical protein
VASAYLEMNKFDLALEILNHTPGDHEELTLFKAEVEEKRIEYDFCSKSQLFIMFRF